MRCVCAHQTCLRLRNRRSTASKQTRVRATCTRQPAWIKNTREWEVTRLYLLFPARDTRVLAPATLANLPIRPVLPILPDVFFLLLFVRTADVLKTTPVCQTPGTILYPSISAMITLDGPCLHLFSWSQWITGKAFITAWVNVLWGWAGLNLVLDVGIILLIVLWLELVGRLTHSYYSTIWYLARCIS